MNNHIRDSKQLGGKPTKSPNRALTFKATDFSVAEQATPVPIFYGTVQISGTHMVPVFNFSATAITTEVGK